MKILARIERNLIYKLANLLNKYPVINWSLDELARRWHVAKKTLVKLFRKLRAMGYLIEVRDHYHEVFRSLTNEALEAIKSGVFSSKKIFERKPIGNRSETDRSQGKNKPDTYIKNNNYNHPAGASESEIRQVLTQHRRMDMKLLSELDIITILKHESMPDFVLAYNETCNFCETGGILRSATGFVRNKIKQIKELRRYLS